MTYGERSQKFCTWCTLPIRALDTTKTLERLIYHDVCFHQFEVWFRAECDRRARQGRLQ